MSVLRHYNFRKSITTKKETKNILKYKEHEVYIQHILNVKTKAISVTIGNCNNLIIIHEEVE